MVKIKFIYEVETRFNFKDKAEVYKTLPFLKKALEKELRWETVHFGSALFREDIVLRVSKTNFAKHELQSLAYKEADLGETINIRREYSEKIDENFVDSEIINILGGNRAVKSREDVIKEIEKIGHKEFMSFNGKSFVGDYKSLKIKLMYTEQIKYPVLLEIEKAASDIKEARMMAKELLDFVQDHNLSKRMIIKEPPTLLYEENFKDVVS
ncbi:hypothetical protein [Halanaerobium hydrogeniformans]|uniref:CYTH domain-containing protein n=1 Tax=Halanaerobium hydrogeniformans TaxID=656519 RepID=E4RIS2_HALHG|nr:hypothetical protein [Halanaerobium hydrogeniformans]ADQ15142.1 hypothetical protein Halsa_1720 [Halanaerobium hydrogeniformans]